MTDPTLYLLDTNAISDMMRNPQGLVAQRVLSASANGSQDTVCTSVIVECELMFGLQRRISPKWMIQYQRVMATIPVLPLDSQIVSHYAQLRSQLEGAGTPIGANDALIAAHARALGATLVSADAEFQRVPGLRAENWLQGA